MNLQHITRGKSNPQGKPRVYFTCHPDDFETAFPVLSADLLQYANCVIYYDADPSEQTEEKQWQAVIDDMQLVVLAVTSKFLFEENRARNAELPYALGRNIPVLPILLENGLAGDFSDICAKIQVVTKHVTDPTATPYEEVLQTFLNSVLVGDELAEKVRDAFDAYVFLSYRKKDRYYAQRLMHLIHEHREYRDIAIWYDEYLVPGEGFNEAIKDAFNKSSLFAMAVTPNLEEAKNYVMRIEYPMARDRKKEDQGFEIVPVEMYDREDGLPVVIRDGKEKDPAGNREEETGGRRIQLDKLKDHSEFPYQDIPDMQDEHVRPELDEALLEALSRIAKKENDGSARHRFFIGLAYLNGIDTEIDPERALDLIKSAANDPEPCIDATAKLADMYLNGEGVKADRKEALSWQEKTAAQYFRAYQQNHDPDEHKGYGTRYFKALRKLSDLQRDSGNIQGAIDSARQALAFVKELEAEVGVREMERDLAVISNRLGSLYRETGDLADARDNYENACRIYEKLSSQIGTARARRDLSISYERLGDLYRKAGKLAEAEEYYRKALEIRRKLNESSETPSSRRDLSAILTKLGNARKSAKDYAGAGKYYEEALGMDEVLAAELKTPQANDDYGVSLVKTGDIHKAEGRLDDAALCYQRASEIFSENAQKTGSRIFTDHQAGGYEKLASIQKKRGETKEAAKLYEESVALREKLYEQDKNVSSANALATALYNAASFYHDKAMMRKAYEIWADLCKTHPEYIKYRDKAEKLSR